MHRIHCVYDSEVETHAKKLNSDSIAIMQGVDALLPGLWRGDIDVRQWNKNGDNGNLTILVAFTRVSADEDEQKKLANVLDAGFTVRGYLVFGVYEKCLCDDDTGRGFPALCVLLGV